MTTASNYRKRKNSIAFICPYFGKMPWYFGFFIKTCEYNNDIDFYIITDNIIDIPTPSNVKVVRSSFKEVIDKIVDRLELTVNIMTPYKLCDFKPTYGVVFNDILEAGNYEFWGHCDIDVVFGRIRYFITDEILENNDLVSVRHEYTSGFFMIYRNIDKINNLFRKSRDFKYVFASPKSFCFDECSYHHRKLLKGSPIKEIVNYIDAMTYVVMDQHEKGNIRAYFNLFVLEGTPGRVVWNKGVISVENRYEALLYHIMTIKGVTKFSERKHLEIPDIFEFGASTMIYPEEELYNNNIQLIKLDKETYLKEPSVQVVFGQYMKSESGRFRACGVFS